MTLDDENGDDDSGNGNGRLYEMGIAWLAHVDSVCFLCTLKERVAGLAWASVRWHTLD